MGNFKIMETNMKLELVKKYHNGVIMTDGENTLKCVNYGGEINHREFKLYRFHLFLNECDIYDAISHVALESEIRGVEDLEKKLATYLKANCYEIEKTDVNNFNKYEFKAWKELSRKDWFQSEENHIIYTPENMTYEDVITFVRKKGKEIEEECKKGLRRI